MPSVNDYNVVIFSSNDIICVTNKKPIISPAIAEVMQLI
jgi:hypothetical protein